MPPAPRPPLALVGAVPLALVGLAACVLAWRRVVGGLRTPLAWPGLVVLGAAVALLAVAARWAQPKCRGAVATSASWPIGVALSAMLAVLGLAVSLPETSPGGLAAFWSILVAEEALAWSRHVRLRRDVRRDFAADDQTLQHLVRTRSPDGIETIEGWLRASLAPGQRTTSVHVAFCPPLPMPPEVAVEQVNGPPAKVTAAQTLPYGVRFDLKLAELSDQPCEVVLHCTA
ncbi:MAG: hypothetical protein NUV77_08170, partial [Thermoguttaceae bacterium]|nr:hypothetical protein [Thermoguttaceae bacterium]